MKTEIVCPIPSSDAEKNPRNSEGSFIHLKDGRIAFYYTRYYGDSFHDHATADIVVRYSSDNGESWSDFETVIKGPENGNVMSVSLLRLQDGRIMMMYLRKDKHTADACYDCRPTFIFSSDEGVTWTEPETIADIPVYFVGNNDRLVQLSSGTPDPAPQRINLQAQRARNAQDARLEHPSMMDYPSKQITQSAQQYRHFPTAQPCIAPHTALPPVPDSSSCGPQTQYP